MERGLTGEHAEGSGRTAQWDLVFIAAATQPLDAAVRTRETITGSQESKSGSIHSIRGCFTRNSKIGAKPEMHDCKDRTTHHLELEAVDGEVEMAAGAGDVERVD
jgi:hypothetical protein